MGGEDPQTSGGACHTEGPLILPWRSGPLIQPRSLPCCGHHVLPSGHPAGAQLTATLTSEKWGAAHVQGAEDFHGGQQDFRLKVPLLLAAGIVRRGLKHSWA